MYIVQEKPDETAQLAGGGKVRPLVTLKDEYGGICHIIMDDNCYVLINGIGGKLSNMVKHWHREAAIALAELINKEGK